MSSTIEIIANIALALSVVIALIFGVAQVKAAQRDRRERLTLETLRVFNTREFAELIYFVTRLEMPNTREEFLAMPADQQIMLIQAGQQMESVGMLVYERYIDLDLIDKTLGSYVSTMWEKYKPVFEDMRIKNPDPFLGEYLQWLAERVADRLDNHPREPYYKNADPWHTMKK
ncbi:MAG TPA: hypothetical protein VFH95_12840 [Candidatus Kapabacteria bacterium]|nr:hypothetical protein [Candidatus Kapabacteria bacterium]